jgi:methylated-DNA-[protein]-cysteine S-methyltransferase
MAEVIKYTIFKTKWGYFGLAANKKGLIRTCLPCPNPKIVKQRLLSGLDNPEFEKNLLKTLQGRIITYFKDRPPSSACPGEAQRRRVLRLLSSVPLGFNLMPAFTKKVLAACAKIPAGKTVSYSRLAAMIGNPRAGRAVGNALAGNQVPLIIPCHRVIRSDGSLGNFSAPGGSVTKRKLIDHEKR